jgi:hypothetical protein
METRDTTEKPKARKATLIAPEQDKQMRAFVRRAAEMFGVDPDQGWHRHGRKVLARGWDWFISMREEQERLAVDYRASRTQGRNSTPRIQWPHVETSPAPPPIFQSFDDYVARTTVAERMNKCNAAAKKANRERLLSAAPKVRLSARDVWAVCEAARGRCAHCGSLAVERRPSKPNGAPAQWAQVGRRIGSLEHRQWRVAGGNNDLSNLAWSCLWCNTWPTERRPGATDHGGFYPDKPVRSRKTGQSTSGEHRTRSRFPAFTQRVRAGCADP